jgi:Reverse transcriptase (RNA-dependent DNA polymerase)
MFFRMCNSPATFQAMMDEIFKKEIKENLIIVYMDDILAFSKTIDGLKKIKQIILEKAQEYDLNFKAKECKFRKPKIEYLGLVTIFTFVSTLHLLFHYLCSSLPNFLDLRT